MFQLTCTISGSFRRALNAVGEKLVELRKMGFTVLSPRTTQAVGKVEGFLLLEGDEGSPKDIEQGHLSAIRRSDFLYVVNPGGYIGPSATLEIGYALALGIPVYCLTPPSEGVIAMFVKVEPDVSRIGNELAGATADNVPKRADLATLQTYIRKVVHLRGFEQETLRDVVLLLIEEVGELAKAVRKRTGLKTAASGDAEKNVAQELADCLIYLLDIANLAGVDLDAAFRAKEAINSRKVWTSDPVGS